MTLYLCSDYSANSGNMRNNLPQGIIARRSGAKHEKKGLDQSNPFFGGYAIHQSILCKYPRVQACLRWGLVALLQGIL